MGQTLSEPVVDKNTSSEADSSLYYGVSAMQGWRISMEDAHSAVLDMRAKFLDKDHKPTDPNERLSFFGVFDGHGGEKVAQFSGEHVARIISEQKAFSQGDIEQALKDGFLATDRVLLEEESLSNDVSGCTASVAVVSNDKIRVANAGDSRTVLGVKGRAKPLSFDHKPVNSGEKARICAAGGFVDYGRVNGNLALSRALGDFDFKKTPNISVEQQIVTAFPDVTTHEITQDDEFLVIACDGIWDCQSSQGVIEFIRRGITARQELPRICENIMDFCLAPNSETAGVGCDNMSILIVALLNGKTTEEWYDMIADRVAKEDGPCAPPEYAEFRGPRVHPGPADDGYDPDAYSSARDSILTDSHFGGLASAFRAAGRQPGHVIILGDGANVMTDFDAAQDMFASESDGEESSRVEEMDDEDEQSNEQPKETTEAQKPTSSPRSSDSASQPTPKSTTARESPSKSTEEPASEKKPTSSK